MKFLFLTPESNSLFLHWDDPYDARDTLEPFHQLSFLYSKLHNQQPKNDDPNTVCASQEILVEVDETFAPSISSQTHLCSKKGDTQHGYEHDLCSQRLLVSGHFHYHIFERPNPFCAFVDHLLTQDSGIWSPIPNGQTNDLRYGSSFDIQPYSKATNFIETKVTAMKLQGFNR